MPGWSATTQALELVPDILKDVEVEDGRIFTLHLRQGHRWSDGQPFTSEDFRYWWEDVANNDAAQPDRAAGRSCSSTARRRKVEFLDELTVRYSWSKPNPFFLPALAGATPHFIYMPAHYLKQFHEQLRRSRRARGHGRGDPGARLGAAARPQGRHVQLRQPGPADPAALAPDHAAAGRALRVRAQPILPPGRPERPAAALHRSGGARRGRRQADPDQDRRRRDRPAVTRPVLQALHLPQGERGAQRPRHAACGQTAQGAHLALYPNLNANDQVWRELFRDVRFRARAVARRRPRRDQPDHVFRPRASAANNTVLPQSPLYKPEYRDTWAQLRSGRRPTRCSTRSV